MANTIFFIFVAGIITYIGYGNILNNKISSITETLLNTIDWNISIMVNDVRDISTIIQDSQEIQGFLGEHEYTQESHFHQKRLIRNLVTNITTTKDFINMVYVGNENNEYYQQTFSKGDSFNISFDQIYQSGIHKMIQDSEERGTWLKGEDLNLPGNNLLVYVRPIINLNTLEQNGIILIGINSFVFKTMLDVEHKFDSIIAVSGRDHLLYISNDNINQANLINNIQSNSEKGNGVDIIGGDKFLVNYITNDFTGWKIIAMLPYSTVMKETYYLLWIALILIIISLIISIIIAITLSNRVTEQLRKLNRVFSDINSKRSVPILYFDENDEIGQIGNEAIKLFHKNEELNRNLYELMVKEKEAELLALQSQINPHFLYNTLDSIFWMAERAKCKNISKMVLNLSKLFKLSLNNGDKFTTIKREFEHIYTYLEIQNIRYRGKFKTLINIDPDLLDKKIMRLIIQPIVENSIYHGIEPMSGDGLIEINGVQENNTISIVVRDNGIGFNTDEIETRGYALKNINKRIKLNYGNEYGLLIKSRKNEGTTVTIRIPATN